MNTLLVTLSILSLSRRHTIIAFIQFCPIRRTVALKVEYELWTAFHILPLHLGKVIGWNCSHSTFHERLPSFLRVCKPKPVNKKYCTVYSFTKLHTTRSMFFKASIVSSGYLTTLHAVCSFMDLSRLDFHHWPFDFEQGLTVSFHLFLREFPFISKLAVFLLGKLRFLLFIFFYSSYLVLAIWLLMMSRSLLIEDTRAYSIATSCRLNVISSP